MANHLAIAAAAKTILKMVEDHCPREEFAATPTFTLYGSHDFGSPQVTEGFSLLVWRIGVNSTVRKPAARREADLDRLADSVETALDWSKLRAAWPGCPV